MVAQMIEARVRKSTTPGYQLSPWVELAKAVASETDLAAAARPASIKGVMLVRHAVRMLFGDLCEERGVDGWSHR